jgi:hypothetical protein
MRALLSEDQRAPAAESRDHDDWPDWLGVAGLHEREIETVDAATRSLAARPFDGRECLFPDTRRERAGLHGRAETLRCFGLDIAATSGHRDPNAAEPCATLEEDVSRRSSLLVARARTEALALVGRADASLSMAEHELGMVVDAA